MSGDRRLRLVPPPQEPGALVDIDPPASEEELEQARALAESLERGEDALAIALRAAAAPAGRREIDHDALIARALGDEAVPPTVEEQRGADALRAWLDDPAAPPPTSAEGEPAAIAGALRAAWSPAALPEIRHEALIARALGRHRGAGRRRIVPVTMAALSSLAAAAAAVALLFSSADAPGPHAPAAQIELIPSRSTAALFDPATPFPREGGETARIDRIAGARAADLRANRYAAWGVR